MSDYVVVHRGWGQLDAELLRDVLEQERIPVRVVGMESPANMAGMLVSEYRFEVPVGQAEQATALIEAFLSKVEVSNPDDLPWELREDDDEADETKASGRLSVEDSATEGELSLSDGAGHVSVADEPDEVEVDPGPGDRQP